MSAVDHSYIINELALKVLKSLDKANSVCIPAVGILHTLNTVLQATNSEKLIDQIGNLLHFNSDDKNKKQNEKVKLITDLIHDILNGDKEFITINLKNGICFPDVTKMEDISVFPNINVYQKDAEIKKINEEILKLTEGKLMNFLDHHNTPRSGVTLFDVLHIKAPFCNIFQPDSTTMETFHVNSTKSIQIPMLKTGGMVMYNDDKEVGARVMYHSFMGCNFNVMVIVPSNKFGLSKVEEKLTTQKYNNLLNNMRPVLGSLSIPKLCINQTTDLKEVIKNCGLPDLFNSSFSNLTKLVKSNMAADHFIQGTSINLNEFGCNIPKRELFEHELYGMCCGGFASEPEKQDIIANEPFLLIITYCKGNAIVSINRILEPIPNEH